MSNNFLTVNEIAKESLMRLQNNLVMASLVHKDFSDEFANKGDTVNVRKPATFVAKDFTSTIDTQGIAEQAVGVKLDKIADVSVEVTSKQLALNVQDFGEQIVEGAMQALAQKIDADLLELYADVPYTSGTAGTTPAALSDLANAGKVLNANKVPFGNRNLVIDPEAQAKLVILDAITNADKAGTTDGLRNANLGRVLGLDTYLDQNVVNHAKGTLAAGTGKTIQLDAEVDEGATTLKFKASEGDLTGTAKVGDIFTIADAEGQYTITEVSALSGGKQVVKFYPACIGGFSTGKNVTFVANHTANVAFHKNAFALVNRPQALPLGGAEGYVANFDGLSIRVTMGYTMSSKINTISFDVLYGVKTLDPNLAVRVLG